MNSTVVSLESIDSNRRALLTLFNLGVFNNSVPLMFVLMGTKFFVRLLAINREATAGSCSYSGPARESTEV